MKSDRQRWFKATIILGTLATLIAVGEMTLRVRGHSTYLVGRKLRRALKAITIKLRIPGFIVGLPA